MAQGNIYDALFEHLSAGHLFFFEDRVIDLDIFFKFDFLMACSPPNPDLTEHDCCSFDEGTDHDT